MKITYLTYNTHSYFYYPDMNRQYLYIILTIFLFTGCRKDTGSSNPVLEQMCQRLFPQHADSFEFELLNDSNQMDRFILELSLIHI